MADIKKVLIDEIRRLAKKEVKAEVAPLAAKVAELKKTVSELKKSLKLAKSNTPAEPKKEASAETNTEKSVRLNADKIRKIREKLGLSQKDFATLVDSNNLSVSHWELGKTAPRTATKQKIAKLRTIGKREFVKLCADKGIVISKSKLRTSKKNAEKVATTNAEENAQ